LDSQEGLRCSWSVSGHTIFGTVAISNGNDRPLPVLLQRKYSLVPHNDVSVNDGPHIRQWSLKIIIL